MHRKAALPTCARKQALRHLAGPPRPDRGRDFPFEMRLSNRKQRGQTGQGPPFAKAHFDQTRSSNRQEVARFSGCRIMRAKNRTARAMPLNGMPWAKIAPWQIGYWRHRFLPGHLSCARCLMSNFDTISGTEPEINRQSVAFDAAHGCMQGSHTGERDHYPLARQIDIRARPIRGPSVTDGTELVYATFVLAPSAALSMCATRSGDRESASASSDRNAFSFCVSGSMARRAAV